MKDFYLSGASNPSLCRLADVLLMVSPAVPPCCYGQVLAVCERRGFSLKGLQRLQLQSDGAALLRLTNQQVPVRDNQDNQKFQDPVIVYFIFCTVISC